MIGIKHRTLGYTSRHIRQWWRRISDDYFLFSFMKIIFRPRQDKDKYFINLRHTKSTRGQYIFIIYTQSMKARRINRLHKQFKQIYFHGSICKTWTPCNPWTPIARQWPFLIWSLIAISHTRIAYTIFRMWVLILKDILILFW